MATTTVDTTHGHGDHGHDAHGHGHGHGHQEHVAHAVPLKVLIGVYVVLMICTYLTVAVTNFEFGAFNVWVALAIAVVKAAVVALYFMHLRWDSPFNAICLICAMFFVALFMGIAILDAKEYHNNLLPPGAQSAHP